MMILRVLSCFICLFIIQDEIAFAKGEKDVLEKVPSNVTESEITALLDKWRKGIESGNQKEVVSLYSKNAILLPTISDKIEYGHSEIGKYFDHFLKLQPKVSVILRHIKIFSNDTAVDTGKYIVTTKQNGKEFQVTARYTFVYERIAGKWLIKVHHSSRVCESE